MRKFNFLLMKALLVFSLLCVIPSCKDDDKEDNDGTNNGNNTEKPVPDPEGTITANLGRIFLGGGFNVDWISPNDMQRTPDHCMGGDCGYYRISFCNVGEVSGLGSINKIPTLGYAPTAACEKGHGYVIKCEINGQQEVSYARLYIVEPIISTGGGIMGAKVKYQYPWNP